MKTFKRQGGELPKRPRSARLAMGQTSSQIHRGWQIAMFAAVWFVGAACLSSAEPVSFVREIAPILQQKCATCHNSEKRKGGYRLDTFASLRRPGKSGDLPVVAGNPARAKIIELITASDPDDRMPQKDDPLPAGQVSLIRRWMEEGAKFDGPDGDASLVSLIPRLPHPAPPRVYRFPMPVCGIAFTPDGGEIVAGGYHEILFWSVTNGKLLRRIADLPERIQALSLSADGSLLLVAGGEPGRSGEVSLVSAAESRVIKRWDEFADLVLAAVFSPRGNEFVVGGTDNALFIYDSRTGTRRLLGQHADWITAVAFSPDGNKVASASRDRTARIYDVKSGELESTYADQASAIQAVAFSPDGAKVFTAGRDGRIHVWAASDGKKQTQFRDGTTDAAVLFGCEAGLFAGDADGKVRLYSVAENKLERSFDLGTTPIFSVALNASRKRLAAGDFAGNVKLWTFDGGTPVLEFKAWPAKETVGDDSASQKNETSHAEK
jgi:hypothetical protein